MVITEIQQLEKGKVKISFDDAEALILYHGELQQSALAGCKEQMQVSEDVYEQVYRGIIGKRVIKRAMHLLEKMDRTEEQLRRKLMESGYPQELIEEAVVYVKSYHYIDDNRYARTFIRLNQERKSSGRMRMDLLSRGISQDIIERALEEENETEQEQIISRLVEKKHYNPDTATPKETQKIYQFLLRRGFRSSEIMHVLKQDR